MFPKRICLFTGTEQDLIDSGFKKDADNWFYRETDYYCNELEGNEEVVIVMDEKHRWYREIFFNGGWNEELNELDFVEDLVNKGWVSIEYRWWNNGTN